jgi:hypothetical protein
MRPAPTKKNIYALKACEQKVTMAETTRWKEEALLGKSQLCGKEVSMCKRATNARLKVRVEAV